MSASEALELLVACDRCGADVGEWCYTKTMKRATIMHGARYRKTQSVRMAFWLEQEYEVKSACERILSHPVPAAMAANILRTADSMIDTLTTRQEAS